MKCSSLLLGWWIGVVISFITPDAAAQRVVFVSNQGPPLKDATIAPLLTSLEQQGFLASPSKIRSALGARFPMAAHNPMISAADFAKVLEQANRIWIQQPPLKQMLSALEDAVEMARTNPEYLIRDPSRRERFRQLLVALAITYQRAGDVKRSEDTMADLLRTFPNLVVSRSKDGPAAEQLYLLTRANQSRLGRGTLTIKVSDPDVQVYIDERIARPNVPMADLVPGPNRIVVLDRFDRARRYDVPVLNNQSTVLDLDWNLDPAMYVTSLCVELRFQVETERARRAELVRQLVQFATSADAFVLVDVMISPEGQLHVIASLRRVASGRPMREAAIVVTGGDDTAALQALGWFIGGGPTSSLITVRVAEDVTEPAPRGSPTSETRLSAAPRSGRPRMRKYVATAAAGIGLVGGIVLVYLGDVQICGPSERDSKGECPRITQLRPAGFVTLGASVALGGLAGYFWFADRRSRTRIGLQLDPARAGGLVVASWRLP